jgi:hypothetical protein
MICHNFIRFVINVCPKITKASHYICRLSDDFSPCSTMQHIHSMTPPIGTIGRNGWIYTIGPTVWIETFWVQEYSVWPFEWTLVNDETGMHQLCIPLDSNVLSHSDLSSVGSMTCDEAHISAHQMPLWRSVKMKIHVFVWLQSRKSHVWLKLD